MAIRLKVEVSTLVAKAEEKLAELEAGAEEAQREYERAVADYPLQLITYVEREARKMQAEGKVWAISSGRYGRDDGAPEFPNEPQNEREIARVKRDIGLLRASSQPTVTIGTDSDLARYL